MVSYADSKLWGPYAWYMIHSIAFHFPQTKVELPPSTISYQNKFLSHLRIILPCPSCREHFKRTLTRSPPLKTMKTGITSATWGIDSHNIVNRAMNKKEYNYKTALPLYTKAFNHAKAIKFIYYLLVKNINKPLKSLKIVTVTMINLFPCKTCHIFLQKYLSDNIETYKKANTLPLWTAWIKKLYIAFSKASVHS